jgi:hypothetical protein
MEPLDLTRRPPRGPREPLDGLDALMLARTVDKLRATLPGGNIGSYNIPGFSARLLQRLGIEEDALRNAIASARSDSDVADWVRANSNASTYPEINDALLERKIGHRINDADFIAKYPNAPNYPPDMPLIEFLSLDDKEMFPTH